MTLTRRSLLAGLVPISAMMLDVRATEAPAHTSAHGAARTPETFAGWWQTGDEVSDQRAAAEPPGLNVPRTPVGQGGSVLVGVTGDGIRFATVEFRGWEHSTVREGGVLLAIVPAGQRIGETEQPTSGVYPLLARVQLADEARPRTLETSVSIVPWDFPVEHLTFTPGVATLLDPALTDQENATLRAAYGGFSPARLWDGFFVRPSAAAVSDVYGARRSYQGGPVSGSHSGVDFGASSGAPVLAAAHGRVVLAQPTPVRGNMVILDHGVGVFTGYCHLSSAWVEPGQTVRAGEPIAATGATGLVTGAHLHWEVVVGLQHVDGLRWLQA